MTSKLGVYWSVQHRRQVDYDYFKALQPSVFKIMDGGVPDYAFARDNLPGALVLARDWALSEQMGDMLADPGKTGVRHAHEWSDHQHKLGFDPAKTLILGINEPHIWEPGVPEALRQYTIALCDEATRLGLRVGAMQLSVGWPNNTGHDTPPDWSAWHGVEEAILRNGGALICHEYWADRGPSENWGWWAGRSLKCPWQVPIVIGECGVDMFVKDTSVGQQNRGWLGHMPPERYAAELAEYVSRMSADPRFVGCCVFASDFAAHEWYSFDVEPAYKAILATPIAATPTTPPFETHIPALGSGPQQAPAKTAYVSVPSGANLRKAPSVDGDLITAIPYGEQILVYPDETNTHWRIVEYQGKSGYMNSSLFTFAKPPAPVQPSGDNFERALAFIRKWEGGWADNPADPGGATNKGITIGTYARWREVHGQPAPSKDDLRNLSDTEATEIYRQWYWAEGSADKLPFPLCLAHFDTAVNAGPARAQAILSASGGNFLAYMGHLIEFYVSIQGFETFGRAWMKRRADLMLEASKP